MPGFSGLFDVLKNSHPPRPTKYMVIFSSLSSHNTEEDLNRRDAMDSDVYLMCCYEVSQFSRLKLGWLSF
jgi:hypothetical protein